MECNKDRNNKKPLIILSGPTATGKSAFAVLLAKKIGGEIISADSMQVYKGMDIGSAKITEAEMEGVPHYLIDILEPSEPFDVTVFQSYAKEALETIWAHGNIPIVTGGTGFYIQALLYDIDFSSGEGDKQIRDALEEEAKTNPEKLYEELKRVDPAATLTIHPNNIKRVIRALEYYKVTGKPISEHNEMESKKESPYNYAYFVLTDDRNIMYEKIDRRVDQMVSEGLVQEVMSLKEKGFQRSDVAMQGLGYKEILDYLDNKTSLEDAIYIIKRDTRHFAKRQLTWFRRERDIIWLDKQELPSSEKLLEKVTEILKNKKIL